MESCGIIVEYNPFHNGHKYHAKMARELSGADVVIAVMSGNFLQRGEPAIMDKWTRTEEAIKNGVDLVIELPFAWSVQSADYFARGAIKILQSIGCEALCFGTDVDQAIDYADFGLFVAKNQEEIDILYQEINQKTMSYPQQMTAVFRKLYPEMILDFTSPNHILGLSYAKENARYKQPMQLYPLKRKQAGYHDTTIKTSVSSATAIRKALVSEAWSAIETVVPAPTYSDLQQKPLLTWENYWPLLQYTLRSQSTKELAQIYQMKEGIEFRLKEASLQARDFTDFINKVKTKRYTWARIQRLATYVLNQVKQSEIEKVWSESYIHILGFTEQGQRFLKENKKKIEVPIISRVAKDSNQQLALSIRTDQIYCLGNQQLSEQNYGRFPIRSFEHKENA